MKTTNTKKPRKLLLISAIMLALLLVLGGVQLVRHQKNNEAIAKERAQYAQAEKELDSLNFQIRSKLGQPDDSKKLKECGYTSSDFGTGILYCNINVFLLYPVEDREDVANIVAGVRGADPIFGNLADEQDSVGVALSKYSLNGLNCFADISFHQAEDNLLNQGYADIRLLNSSQGALIQLNCSVKHPRSAYYPLKNS